MQDFLTDLRTVGPLKPLGCLPISTLVDICRVTPEEMREELEEKGLVVVQLSNEESSIASGALYAYHEQALSGVLQAGKDILKKNNWPTEPREFVCHLKILAKDPELFTLIMKAFADPRLQEGRPIF